MVLSEFLKYPQQKYSLRIILVKSQFDQKYQAWMESNFPQMI